MHVCKGSHFPSARSTNVEALSCEWCKNKDTIIELYRSSSLKDVMQIMETRHGLRASKRQYDRKLKARRVSKNLKAAEKDKIISNVLAGSGAWATGSPPKRLPSACQLDIQPHHFHRAVRHFKAQNRRLSSRSPTASKHRTAGMRASKSSSPTSEVETSPQDRSPWISLEPDSILTVVDNSAMNKKLVSRLHEVPPDFDDPIPSHTFRDEETWSWVGREVSCDSDAAARRGSSNEVQIGSINTRNVSPVAHNTAIYFDTIPVMLDLDPWNNVQKLLKGLYAYISTLTDPSALISRQSSCKPHPVAGARFWSEVGNGIYLLKVGSELAWSALHNAGKMLDEAFRDPRNLNVKFMREIFLTLSPTNTKISPVVRAMFLQLLQRRASELLGARHPVTMISTELLKDGNEQEVSERGLRCCVDAIYANRGLNDSSGIAIQVECAIIKSHRRDGDLELAAAEASSLYRKTSQRICQFEDKVDDTGDLKDTNGFKTQARLAATELAHVRMDQRGDHYDEAIRMSLFALTGRDFASHTTLFNEWPPAPSSVPGQIEDKAVISTAEDLAKICHELGLITRAIEWLVRAEELAGKLLGESHSETVTVHIREKLQDLRLELGYIGVECS